LEDFKSYKTLFQGPRADFAWILKFKPDDLKGHFGHFENFKFPRFESIWFVIFSWFDLANDLV